MTLHKVLLVATVLLLGWSVRAQENPELTLLYEADQAALSVKTWADLQQWEAKYHQYDDGYISESIDGIVENLLTKNWISLKELRNEIKTHPEFERQVFAHLNEAFSCDGCRFVVSVVEKQCPQGCEELCRKISLTLRDSAIPDCLPSGPSK